MSAIVWTQEEQDQGSTPLLNSPSVQIREQIREPPTWKESLSVLLPHSFTHLFSPPLFPGACSVLALCLVNWQSRVSQQQLLNSGACILVRGTEHAKRCYKARLEGWAGTVSKEPWDPAQVGSPESSQEQWKVTKHDGRKGRDHFNSHMDNSLDGASVEIA